MKELTGESGVSLSGERLALVVVVLLAFAGFVIYSLRTPEEKAIEANRETDRAEKGEVVLAE